MTEKTQTATLEDAIGYAESVCIKSGAKLTDNRRNVFEVVHGAGRPIGAYDILEKLSSVTPGAKPPTVYRALEFLLEIGLIHKIESLNAYLSCAHPGHTHDVQMLICDTCGRTSELNDNAINSNVTNLALQQGFTIDHTIFEIHGRCIECS